MDHDNSFLPTLERLLEHLLDLEAKQDDLEKLWQSKSEVNLPWFKYLQPPSRNNLPALRQEIDSLIWLVADCKSTILEFIPAFYKSFPVRAYGQLYFLGKGQQREENAPFLIIRKQGFL